MKKLRILNILFLIAPLTSSKAQVLNNMVQKLNNLKNISYRDVVETKLSFQEEISTDTLQSYITFLPTEKQTGGYYRLKNLTKSFLFDGSKLIILDKTDSTYKIKKEAISGQQTRTLLYWTQKISFYTKEKPASIEQLPDSLINGVIYDRIRITESDTLINSVSCYTKHEFLVTKRTNLPLLIRTQSQGLTDDGLLVSVEEIHNYSGYITGGKDFPDLSVASIPSYFRLPIKAKPKPFLQNGIPAPEITLTDMEGKLLNLKSLKGKTVLLNITSVSCSHCVSAANMLNKITELCGSENLAVINIYPFDNKESIIRFNKRFKVNSPSLTTLPTIQDIYPHEGYPSFYLIDKNGAVSYASTGYHPKLQNELLEKINSIK